MPTTIEKGKNELMRITPGSSSFQVGGPSSSAKSGGVISGTWC
jgi:hypothetical protein